MTCTSVHDTARAYVVAASKWIRENCPEPLAPFPLPPGFATGRRAFVRGFPKFRLTCDTAPIEVLPQAVALKEALREDSAYRDQVGRFISTVGGGFLINDPTYRLGVGYIQETGDLRVDLVAYDKLFLEIDAQFRATTIALTTTAVIVGLDAEQLPIHLADELVLDRLTDVEVEHVVDADMVPTRYGTSLDAERLIALRVTENFTKYLSDPTNPSPPPPRAGLHPHEIVDIGMSALRLTKPGVFWTSGTIQHSRFMDGSASSYTAGLDQPAGWGVNYRVATNDVPVLRTLVKALQSARVRADPGIGVALRRFGYSQTRSRIEDRLVDLLVAAEALFLSGLADPFIQGELTNRLALRAGFLLGTDYSSRRDVYADMAEAYAARSAVVHGATNQQIADRMKKSLDEMVLAAEEHIRAALKAIVERISAGHTIDWNAIVFGRS